MSSGAASLADDEGPAPANAIVLHEDKTYYPSASATYGADVETMVQEEDAQPLTQPIVEPIKTKKFRVGASTGPEKTFTDEFMLGLSTNPETVRNVAIVGHLHHGKTSLVDTLVHETHHIDINTERRLRYTDTHVLEQSRQISLKSTPMSLVLPDTRGKSYLVNLIDTPGHTYFVDEIASALRVADGAVVVVDAVEGILLTAQQTIQHCVRHGIPMTLVLNKVDRLILELRLPPSDAYIKLRQTIEEVNTVISDIDPSPELRLSPERGNVSFASTQMGWCFTLKSFAKMYADTYGPIDLDQFAARLWGNIHFDPRTRKFSRNASPGSKRGFEHFILEPLYKLYSQVIGEDPSALRKTLTSLGIHLKPAVFKMDVRPLLRIVLAEFFGPATGFVDMVVNHLPTPAAGAETKVASTYTGPSSDRLAQSMLQCDPEGPLAIQIVKLYPTADASEFRAFGRILSGTVHKGDKVRVLGENYSPDDEEDMTLQTVSGVYISEARYDVEVDQMVAGNFVTLAGIDDSINKTATVVDNTYDDQLYIFKPIKHMTESVLKVAVEPMVPSELPKMLDGLRKINKTFPLAETRVEESGEHILLGTGELYLDSIMHDLRTIFADIEIKVSDPVVKFCETVVETSALKCYAETQNKRCGP